MVGLADQGELLARQTVDEKDPPQRPGAVQALGEEHPRQLAQLVRPAGGGRVEEIDVVGDVEARIVDPHGIVQTQPRAQHARAEAGQQDEPAVHVAAQLVDARRPAGEAQGPADVRRDGIAVQVQEGLVEQLHALGVHADVTSSRGENGWVGCLPDRSAAMRDGENSHPARLETGARPAMSRRSLPSPEKRTITIPPGSTAVTTPSP